MRSAMLSTLFVCTTSFSFEVSSLLHRSPADERAHRKQAGHVHAERIGALAGTSLAASVGAVATAPLIPSMLQHNTFGVMDRLVAAAATSYTGAEADRITNAMTATLSHSNTFAVLILIPLAILHVAHQSPEQWLDKVRETVARERAQKRAQASSARECEENSRYAGEWLRSLATDLCHEGDDGCRIEDFGCMRCFEVEEQGQRKWVCV